MGKANTEGKMLFEGIFSIKSVDDYDLREKIDNSLLKECILGPDSNLSDREKTVLECRFWKGLTLQNTGLEIGVRGGRAREIEQSALRKTRKHLVKSDPFYAEIQKRVDVERKKRNKEESERRAKEWEESERREESNRKEIEKNQEAEKDLPCPNYVFLKKGVDGELQLEIPSEYWHMFKPITTQTYNRWLKEMSEDQEALKELEECEMEVD